MNAHILSILICLNSVCVGGAIGIRGGRMNTTTSTLESSTSFLNVTSDYFATSSSSSSGVERKLMTSFSPLSCNSDIDTANCQDWSTKNFDTSTKITISCGECVVVDCATKTINAPNGIEVIGKLKFYDYTLDCAPLVEADLPAVTITTPFLHIQGVLEMKSTRATSSKPDVKMIMTGSDNSFLVPYGTTSQSHNVGKKAIAVAGGRLDIRALPTTCQTWTNLIAASASSTPHSFTTTTPTTPPACNNNNPVLAVDWSTGTDQGWTENYSPGGFQVITTGPDAPYFSVIGRKATWQGPAFFLNNYMDCITPDTNYYITLKTRLTKADGLTNCQNGQSGSCLRLTLMSEDSDPTGGANKKSYDAKVWGPTSDITDGEWFNILGVVKFTQSQASTAAMINRRFYFEGPEAGVDIAVKDFQISVEPPSQFAYSGPVCSNLIPYNGDASSSLFPSSFPFGKTNGKIVSKTEQMSNGATNDYFALSGRQHYWASLYYNLETGCITKGNTYNFSMKFRIDSNSPVSIRLFRYREETGATNRSWKTLKQCGQFSKSDGWITCSADITFDEDDEKASLFRFSTETDSSLSTHANIDYDDISVQFKNGPVTSLQVKSTGIDNCWGAGSELLITPNTLNYEDTSVAIVSSVTTNADGSQTIDLMEPYPPATIVHGASTGSFPSEVALLSRNIVWEGATDDPSEPLHGGHLIVLSTPTVPQTLEGIEVRRFGQQQNLGRYPIHFHMSGSVAGSVVSKNLVRESFQRCIVVHGSNDLLVKHNVAYDTMGHCFMLEDGGEKNNIFQYNLGAVTQPAELIRPEETDNFPSTFWITNPENTFEGNVAAGSRGSGFWIELRTSVRAPSSQVENFNPSVLPLTSFTDNVAHSNRGNGMQTYPGSGYKPPNQGMATFKNCKSFRNRRSGIFFHNSMNLHVEGGIFSDNRWQIDIDRAPGITVNGPTLTGFSPEYRTITTENTQALTHCPSEYPLVGVQMHTYWSGGKRNLGAEVKNTNFQHLGSDTGCGSSSAFNVDYYEDKGYFDIRSLIENPTFDASTSSNEINFCQAAAAGIDTIAIKDIDGKIIGTSGYIVSNSARMTSFWPPGTCTSHSEKCAAYCSGVCYRAWSAAVSNFEPENLELEVTDVNTGIFISVRGTYDNDPNDTAEHSKVWRRRRFFAQLPAGGAYSARFTLNGADYWPLYVEYQYDDEPGACGADFSSFTLLEPPTATCDELIKNGDVSALISGWWSTNGGLKVFDESASNQGMAVGNEFRTTSSYGIAQFLDTRCLVVGAKYTITAKVKMYTSSGSPYACSGNSGCTPPQAYIKSTKGTGYEEYGQDWSWAGSLQGAWQDGEWNELEGDFIISSAQASAHSAYVYLNGPPADAVVVWDDISIVPFVEEVIECADSNTVILHDSFDAGSYDGWTSNHSPGGYEVTGPTDFFVAKGRTATWQGPAKILPQNWASCIQATSTYTISSKVRLTRPDGTKSQCEGSIGTSTYGTRCAKLVLFTEDVNPDGGANIKSWKLIGQAFPHKDGEWFDFIAEYDFTEAIISTEHLVVRRMYFENPEDGVEIAIDDFKIERKVCPTDGVVLDADFSAGTYEGWNSNWSPGGFRVTTDTDGGDPYFMAVGREKTWQGPLHSLPIKCMTGGMTYKITAKYRLTRPDGGVSLCQSSGSKCIVLSMYSRDVDGSQRWKNLGGGSAGSDGIWYDFATTFTFDAVELDSSIADIRRVYLTGPEAGVDISMDNFKIELV